MLMLSLLSLPLSLGNLHNSPIPEKLSVPQIKVAQKNHLKLGMSPHQNL
jgi:hypothetical protein